jgi:SAM-dependent methyltransferase
MAPDRARLEAEAERRAQRQSIFGATEYWNAYYSDPGSAGTEYTEEWYCSAAELAKLLPSPASQGDSALVLGCGLSTLGDALHAAGWRVTALDVSPVLVAHLQTRGGPCAPLLGDARHLPCADGAFGLVVDKATIDTVRCGVASEAGAREAYAEACRVLSPGGRLVSVSHSSRASALGAQGLPWSVQESEVACAAAPDAAAEAIDAQRRQLAKQLARLAARLAPPARHALMACARDALPAAGAPGGAAAVERLELLIADLAEVCT